MIETFKEYDWEINRLIENAPKRTRLGPDEGLTEIFEDADSIRKKAIKDVDKITDFEDLEKDLERITNVKRGEKVIAILPGYTESGGRCYNIEVFTVKRLKIEHYAMPVNDIIVETTNNKKYDIDSVYNLDRLTKMLEK